MSETLSETSAKLSETYVKQLKLVDKISEHVVCLRPLVHGDQGDSIAYRFINPECPEYYWIASDQVSLYPFQSASLDDILSAAGKELFKAVSNEWENVKNNPKRVILSYAIVPVESGYWFADQQSKYWNELHGQASLHSFQNWAVLGKLQDGQWIQTSPCIFIDTTNGWCYTKSGNFYRIENESGIIETHQQIARDKLGEC